MSKNGFIPLAVSLASEGEVSPFAHHIYYKKQRAKKKPPVSWDGEEEEDTSERTLFLANIPPNYDYSDVMNVFSCFGTVASVIFQLDSTNPIPPGVLTSRRTSNPGCQRAELIFADDDSMQLALNASLADTRQPCQEGAKVGGTAKWLAQHEKNRPKSETLQLQVDRFMEAFDMREKAAKAAKDGPLVDEDGWTVVRNTSKRRRLLLPKGVEEKGRKKNKGEEPPMNFYKHQKIQKKRDQLAELRRKFEEDKEKLARQTSIRKFKPF